MFDWFTALRRCNSLLADAGALHLLAALVVGVLALLDERQVLGVNLWLKPLKFYVSSVVYLWTLAVLVSHIAPLRPGWVAAIAWTATVVLVFENLCITVQAARGVLSHFNIETAIDGLVFSSMGLAIVVNSLAVVVLLVLYCTLPVPLPPAYLWGIRLGIVLFLAGSAVGGVMGSRLSHTVGEAMGGPGLPVLNWSTTAGDLRVAHFLGLHALQVLPLLGWALSRSGGNTGVLVAGVVLGAVLYGGLVLAVYVQALRGLPVLRL